MWAKWWRKKKNYPKCVPIAKARAMSKGQRGCRKKKQGKQILARHRVELQRLHLKKKKNQGGSAGENSMVRQAQRNYTGSYISGVGGVKVSNQSYQKYYKGLV